MSAAPAARTPVAAGAPAAAGALLAVDGVAKQFGGVAALDGVSLAVGERSVVGLIGPNGSGKTTLVNVINGVHAPDSGEIRLGGAAIGGRPPSELAGRGLSRTFQNARVFSTLTVTQNLFIPLLNAGRAERAAADCPSDGAVALRRAGALRRPHRERAVGRPEAAAGVRPRPHHPPPASSSWTSPSPGCTRR